MANAVVSAVMASGLARLATATMERSGRAQSPPLVSMLRPTDTASELIMLSTKS